MEITVECIGVGSPLLAVLVVNNVTLLAQAHDRVLDSAMADMRALV